MNLFHFFRKTYQDSFRAKPIPSLDGIRGLSCLFVILGHFSYLYAPILVDRFGEVLGKTIAYSFGNQYTGVTFFFVLSGFLITNILIKEQEKTNDTDIKTFFLKRVFRIFPAYYFYMGCILLWMIYNVPNSYTGQDIFAAASYLYNYASDKNPWHMGHFWSLAIEEQFYLIWPIVFLLSFKKLGKKIPLLIILISPLIRIATYYYFPDLRGRMSIMTHTRIDSLMFGCLMAYFYRADLFDKFNTMIKKYKLHLIGAIHILFLARLLQMKFAGKYTMTIGYTIECFFMCCLIIYLVMNKNIVSKFFNLPIMIHIGNLSYSLYLWHVPFAWSKLGSENLMVRLVLVYVCALISYLLIEAPFMNLRSKFLRK
tara:strand:- start:395641 stop:396747 length:1107 start_codon:yes stop_codon:yes gene_type:complete